MSIVHSEFICECDVPTCPGNINRQKLELWGELVAFVEYVFEMDRNSRAPLFSKARTLYTRAAAIPAPTQGGESG